MYYFLLDTFNNLQVQIYINLKTVNRFKYKMDYSLVIFFNVCTIIHQNKGGLRQKTFFAKNAPKLDSFWAKNGQNLALSLRKWHKKNLIGENGGERKINPSANPVTSQIFIGQVQYILEYKKVSRII